MECFEQLKDEETLLREKQAKAVMPLIGPLLDEWDALPNDLKTDSDMQGFSVAVESIYSEMIDDGL